MRFHPLVLLLFFLIGCTDSATEHPIDTEQAPNIVLLFTDDQTYTTINALGNAAIQTPNLDRLAQQSTSFTHAYNMGGWNGAVCVASRSMMISGRFIWRAKQLETKWKAKDSTALEQTWSRLMASRGYDTYMTGKWHVQAPANTIFTEARHIRPGMPEDQGFFGPYREWAKNGNIADWDKMMPPGYNRPKDENDTSWSPTDTSFGGFWQGGKHWSEVVRDDAIDFIDKASKKENPFFMYLAFNAPHDPRQAPQEFIDQYPLDSIQLPENWQAEYPFQDSIGNGRSLRDEALAPFPRTKYATKVHIQEYYAIITHLDEQIGKILDALERSGKLDNTYIFFTADHGLAVGSHGLLGKQNMYDHSMRVPLMVSGPDIPKNKKIDSSVYLQDIMATSLELAGVQKPVYVEFNSLLPLIREEKSKSPYDAIYGCYVDWQRMIRKDGFKLIVYPKINKALLFDMEADPYEMHNLSEEAAYTDKVQSLLAELQGLQASMGDGLDLSGLIANYQ